MKALQSLRRLFARPPANSKIAQTGEKQTEQPDGKYKEQLELLTERAKGLCSDPWLSNQIKIEQGNGANSLNASPEEALPYIRAANSILKDELPAELSKHFEAS